MLLWIVSETFGYSFDLKSVFVYLQKQIILEKTFIFKSLNILKNIDTKLFLSIIVLCD